jgi:hypothetical protein
VREQRSSVIRVAAGLDEASHGPLFDPGSWLAASSMRVTGVREVAARIGFALEVGDPHASAVLPGANRCVWILDHERGVALRLEAWLDEELLMVEELVEVAFDERFDKELFADTE